MNNAGVLIYAIGILLISIGLLVICISLFILMHLKGLEIKPDIKPADVEKQKLNDKQQKDAEKKKLKKDEIDNEQAAMDKAIADFIARGGLPK